MTEPKQSFTEEVQKEAEERYRPFYNQSSYDENALRRSTFIEGANVALSILSSKSEGREFWVDKGYVYSTKLISGNKYTAYSLESDIDAFVLKTSDKIHVIEHSALVAERARNVKLQEEIEQLKIPSPYCPVCGICGVDGCCATERCLYPDLKSEVLKEEKEHSKELFEEITTLRAQLLHAKELYAKAKGISLEGVDVLINYDIEAKLKLAVEQRNEAVRIIARDNPEYDFLKVIADADLELQKKGQGDE